METTFLNQPDNVRMCSKAKTSKCMMKFRQNCYVRLLVYSLTLITCGGIYYNWPYFQSLMFHSYVYDKSCLEVSLANETCDRQKAKMQSFLLIASSFEYIIGVFAGAILDHMGPLICGGIGIITLLISIIILAATKIEGLYYLGFILVGSSTNLIAYPTLCLQKQFMNHAASVVTFVMSCQIATAIIPLIMNFFLIKFPSLNFTSLLVGYIIFSVIPFGGLFLLTLPSKSEYMGNNAELRKTSKHDSSTDEKNSHGEKKSTSVKISDLASSGINSEEKNETDTNLIPLKSCSLEKDIEGAETNSTNSPKNDYHAWKYFLREMKTLEIHLFTLFYVIQLLQYIYFVSIVSNFYSEEVGKYLGNFLMPNINTNNSAGLGLLGQAFLGIFFAWVIKYTKTLFLCLCLCCLNLIVYLTMLFGSSSLWYLTVFPNLLIGSFLYSSKFTYVMEVYKEVNVGKLTGYCGLMGGMAALAFTPATDSLDWQKWLITLLVTFIIVIIVDISYQVGNILSFILVAVLMYRLSKNHTYIKESMNKYL